MTNQKPIRSMFGIDLNDPKSKCSGRPGIVELRDPDAPTGWRPFCYHLKGGTDNPSESPVTCECEHEALSLIATSVRALLLHAMERDMDAAQLVEALPHPTDLRYTFIDVEPDGLDADVVAVDDAAAVLAKVMGGV